MHLGSLLAGSALVRRADGGDDKRLPQKTRSPSRPIVWRFFNFELGEKLYPLRRGEEAIQQESRAFDLHFNLFHHRGDGRNRRAVGPRCEFR